MRPSDTATLAGLLIEKAYEEAGDDPRICGQRLHEAEQLISDLQGHIEHIRQTAPNPRSVKDEALSQTKSKLTVEEFERQNEGIAAARERNIWSQQPSGIRNY